MFDKWLGLIIDPDTYLKNYDATYQTDITIQQLNEQNLPVYGVTLKNAFPVTVNSTALSNESSDTQKLTVTMTYDDFEPAGGISSTFGGIKNTIKGFL